MADDLSLMFENCKRFNRVDSRLYKDGCRLQKIFQTKLEELLTDDEEEDADEEEDEEKVGSRAIILIPQINRFFN